MTGGNLHRPKELVRLEKEATDEWTRANRRSNRPASPPTPRRRNWEPTHHAGQGYNFDAQAGEEVERQREQSNLRRMQATKRGPANETAHNQPQRARNPERRPNHREGSRRERAVAREETTALRNVRQRGPSTTDPFPGTSDPEELGGTGLCPAWYQSDEGRGATTTPLCREPPSSTT
jgi:hypothetical protein